MAIIRDICFSNFAEYLLTQYQCNFVSKGNFNFKTISYLYSFFTMLKWQKLHKISYLKRIFNDTRTDCESQAE